MSYDFYLQLFFSGNRRRLFDLLHEASKLEPMEEALVGPGMRISISEPDDEDKEYTLLHFGVDINYNVTFSTYVLSEDDDRDMRFFQILSALLLKIESDMVLVSQELDLIMIQRNRQLTINRAWIERGDLLSLFSRYQSRLPDR